MLREFQVLYRVPLPPTSVADMSAQSAVTWPAAGPDPSVCAPLHSILVRAETEGEALDLVQRGNVAVHSIGPGRPVLDWEQEIWNREEAAVWMHGHASKVDALMAKGFLPKAKNGHPLFTRGQLLAAIERLMGK